MSSWFWLAILASLFWGITYVINQYLLRYLDPWIIFFISALLITLVLGIYLSFTHQWQENLAKFSGNYRLIAAMLAYSLLYLLAGILILKSIAAGNASLAAIIESAYPIFTIVFAYLILGEVQVNWGVAGGVSLILIGLSIIQMTSPK